MYKKILCLIIGVGLIVLACGFFTHRQEKKVTLQFASWGSESEINILKPILKDFEQKNPDIKVDFMHIPQNYFQKIHLLFASNTAPDVVFLNNQYLPVYANAGKLEDLSGYKNYFELDKFYDVSVKSLEWEGKIYGVPRDVSNLVVFYNKDIFDRYKMNYPRKNWSYEEFLKTAKSLSHPPEVYGISFDEDPLFFIPYMTIYGGWTEADMKNFSSVVLKNERNLKGLRNYAQLRGKYHAAPRKNESASKTMAQMFLGSELAMQVSGRWLVPKYTQEAKFHWDVANFPTANKEGSIPLDSSGWAISKNSSHKKEALRLVKHLSSYESSEKFTASGLIVPARVDVAKSDVFMGSKGAQVFLTAIENSKPTPVTVNYREILDVLRSDCEYIFARF